MIKLTGRDGVVLWLNPRHITAVHPYTNNPDLTIVSSDGYKDGWWFVKESVDTVVNMIHTEENTANG